MSTVTCSTSSAVGCLALSTTIEILLDSIDLLRSKCLNEDSRGDAVDAVMLVLQGMMDSTKDNADSALAFSVDEK